MTALLWIVTGHVLCLTIFLVLAARAPVMEGPVMEDQERPEPSPVPDAAPSTAAADDGGAREDGDQPLAAHPPCPATRNGD